MTTEYDSMADDVLLETLTRSVAELISHGERGPRDPFHDPSRMLHYPLKAIFDRVARDGIKNHKTLRPVVAGMQTLLCYEPYTLDRMKNLSVCHALAKAVPEIAEAANQWQGLKL